MKTESKEAPKGIEATYGQMLELMSMSNRSIMTSLPRNKRAKFVEMMDAFEVAQMSWSSKQTTIFILNGGEEHKGERGQKSWGMQNAPDRAKSDEPKEYNPKLAKYNDAVRKISEELIKARKRPCKVFVEPFLTEQEFEVLVSGFTKKEDGERDVYFEGMGIAVERVRNILVED